jgi:LysR family transcriptional regulator, regulator for bpeEF and oprC
MDQLGAMRAFVRVVEAGTFTRAAHLLAMPKPTVTKLIQGLEAHVRTKLLNRTTRRVTVTPDGAAYYERVVRLLADLDEIDGSMTKSQASLRGRIRIDVSASLALLVIIPALSDFHARYPEIQIDLGVSDRPVDLVAENVDCVVRAGELADQSLVARRIGELRFITCAAPAYIARHGEPRHPRDLEAGHHVVSYFSTHTGRTFPLSFQADGQQIELAGRYIVSVNDGNAYVAVALAGLGVAQAPIFMVERHIAKGELVPVLKDWQAEVVPLHVVYPPNRHLSSKLRVFVDWIADVFATQDLIRRRVPARA